MMNLQLLMAVPQGEHAFCDVFRTLARDEARFVPDTNQHNAGSVAGSVDQDNVAPVAEVNVESRNDQVMIHVHNANASSGSADGQVNQSVSPSSPFFSVFFTILAYMVKIFLGPSAFDPRNMNATATTTSDEGDHGPVPSSNEDDAHCPLIRQVSADGNGVGPAVTILEGQNRAILPVLLQAENDRGDRPLHRAAAAANMELIHFIVNEANKRMDPAGSTLSSLRAKNIEGQTCLHEAIRHGHLEVVRYLVLADAYLENRRRSSIDDVVPPLLVQIVDNEGISPLYLATTFCRDDIVQVLIGKPPCQPIIASYSGPAGQTALHAAVLLTEGTDTISSLNRSFNLQYLLQNMSPLSRREIEF